MEEFQISIFLKCHNGQDQQKNIKTFLPKHSTYSKI